MLTAIWTKIFVFKYPVVKIPMGFNVKIISNKQRRDFEKKTKITLYVPSIIFSLSSVYIVPRNKKLVGWIFWGGGFLFCFWVLLFVFYSWRRRETHKSFSETTEENIPEELKT